MYGKKVIKKKEEKGARENKKEKMCNFKTKRKNKLLIYVTKGKRIIKKKGKKGKVKKERKMNKK